MKFADYDKIVNGAKYRNAGGYAVAFHWIEFNGREMVPDTVPELGERPYDTEIAAWEYASEMARKRADVMCNIHVIHRGTRLDGRPVRDAKQRMLLPRGYIEHPPRVWGYCRGSTLDQIDTLSQQEFRIQQYKLNESTTAKLPWGEIVIERGVSAAKLPWMDRPQAAALHLSMKAGDHLIVVKQDRAFRNTKDQINMLDLWDRLGIYVHIPDVMINTANPANRLASRMCAAQMAVWAEHESRIISDRLKESISARRRAGQPLQYCAYYAPLGFTVTRDGKGKYRYAPAVEERKLMKRIVQWTDAGWNVNRIHLHLYKIKAKHPRLPQIGAGKDWIIRAYIASKLIEACHKAGIDDTLVANQTLKIPYNIKWPARMKNHISCRPRHRWIREQDTSCLPLLPASPPIPQRELESIPIPQSA